MGKTRSNFWYLLPLFLGLLGAVIGYFIIKKDDPVKAKRLIYVGLVIIAIGITNTAVQTAVAFGSIDMDQLLSIISPAFSLVN